MKAIPKKRGNKLTSDEIEIVGLILEKVYDAMQEDEILGTYIDDGRIVLSLTKEQMFDLFEAKRKLC